MANNVPTAMNRLAWDDDDAQTRRVDPAVREAVLRNARAYEAQRTARVAALPAAPRPLTFVEELALIARRYTLQVGGAAVALAIAVTYLVVGGGEAHVAEASPAPIVVAKPRSAILEVPDALPSNVVVTPIDVAPPAVANEVPAADDTTIDRKF